MKKLIKESCDTVNFKTKFVVPARLFSLASQHSWHIYSLRLTQITLTPHTRVINSNHKHNTFFAQKNNMNCMSIFQNDNLCPWHFNVTQTKTLLGSYGSNFINHTELICEKKKKH